MEKSPNEYKNLDNAIDDYVASNNDVGAFVTGWYLVASLSSPVSDTGDSDGYVTLCSMGLPHHAQIGLLTVALDDKRNMSIVSTINSMIDLDDDEDEEE
jgi:hypothetical protein